MSNGLSALQNHRSRRVGACHVEMYRLTALVIGLCQIEDLGTHTPEQVRRLVSFNNAQRRLVAGRAFAADHYNATVGHQNRQSVVLAFAGHWRESPPGVGVWVILVGQVHVAPLVHGCRVGGVFFGSGEHEDTPVGSQHRFGARTEGRKIGSQSPCVCDGVVTLHEIAAAARRKGFEANGNHIAFRQMHQFMVYMVAVGHPVALHKISGQIPLLSDRIEQLRRAECHQDFAAVQRQDRGLLHAQRHGIGPLSDPR